MLKLILHDVLRESIHQVVHLEVLRGGYTIGPRVIRDCDTPKMCHSLQLIFHLFLVELVDQILWVTRDCGTECPLS